MNVAILQIWNEPGSLDYGGWLNVGVFDTRELAEAEASLRGYTRWSVSEFGVQGL